MSRTTSDGEPDRARVPIPPLDAPRATFWHSGRDALRALARANRARFARTFFPSFYCQDVAVALRADGFEVHAYDDTPSLNEPSREQLHSHISAIGLRAGDALVVSNTLGLRGSSPMDGATLPDGVTVVEDHTHDPLSEWAATTRAPFAFASLRKWAPIPDGAILWSGSNCEVPEPPPLDAAHAAVTLDRLSGMLLKAHYLCGEPVDKTLFRSLLVVGEERIAQDAPGAMSPLARALLEVIDMGAHRRSRQANFAVARDALRGLSDVLLLVPGEAAVARNATPFAVTLVLPSQRKRDSLRSALIGERIYPAVLWPIDQNSIDGTTRSSAELSARLLSLHCDHRYTPQDMARVARAVRRLVEGDA